MEVLGYVGLSLLCESIVSDGGRTGPDCKYWFVCFLRLANRLRLLYPTVKDFLW